MSTSLQKGGNIVLTKKDNPMQRVVVACGWDVNQAKRGIFSSESDYDLDLTAAGLDASGKVPDLMDPTDRDYQDWFIHANHRYPSDGSLRFMEDNRTGAGDGDDEQIKVDLARVHPSIETIVFAVVIWRAEERGQKFGNVRNAFIRVFDETTGRELTRYDLGAEFSNESLVAFGELYRRGDEFKFRAVGQGYDATDYRRQYNIMRAFETEYARPGYPN